MGSDGARGRQGPMPPDGPAVVVRSGAEADAAAAARLHAGQIGDGFLSFLGPGFLTRLYRRVVRAPGSFLLVADDGGTVVGSIAGSADVGGLYRSFLVHDGLAAGLSAAPRLLRGWRRVLETLGHGTGGGADTGRGTELLAVAVDPDRNGQGIGTGLVAAFLEQVAGSGGTESYVVVGADNRAAIALYARAGFVAGPPFELHAGTSSVLMQRGPAGEGVAT